MRHLIGDLSGNRYEKVLVLRKSDIKKGTQFYLCRCDCGHEWEISSYRLVRTEERKKVRNCFSCGRKKAGAKMLKHGETAKGHNTRRIYNIWNGMKARVKDTRPNTRRRYLDRGIGACEEWTDKDSGYDNFVAWALANGYENHLTLDRKDNDKGYSPENCQWSTMKEQVFNRECTRRLTIDGQIMTIKEGVSYFNNVITYEIARRRIRDGWEPVKALTTPKLTRKKETPRSDPSEWIRYAPESFSISLISEHIEEGVAY